MDKLMLLNMLGVGLTMVSVIVAYNCFIWYKHTKPSRKVLPVAVWIMYMTALSAVPFVLFK